MEAVIPRDLTITEQNARRDIIDSFWKVKGTKTRFQILSPDDKYVNGECITQGFLEDLMVSLVAVLLGSPSFLRSAPSFGLRKAPYWVRASPAPSV